MGFEEFEPIIGEPKPEWGKDSGSRFIPLRRFLMYVFAPDYIHLKILVTDFHSNTFEVVKSVPQLEDMMDGIGIGGSWSEFIDYFVASFRSEDVKLVLDKHSDSDGAAYAKLVAQKSKGMPLIPISLIKLSSTTANDGMEDISFGLFKAFKSAQKSVAQDPKNSLQLTKMVTSEMESTENIQSQLEKRQRSSGKPDISVSLSSNDLHESPGKRAARDPISTKVNRVAPAYRRAKSRGAVLRDVEDDEDN